MIKREYLKVSKSLNSSMKKRALLIGMIFLLTLLTLPFINSEVKTLGTFKQNECIELVQTCANCTYINISNIKFPNSTIAVSNVNMQKDGTYFNYTFCDSSVIGTYIVNGFGDVDGIPTVFAYDFEINPQGFTMSSGSGTIYGITLFIVLVIFIICLYYGIALPWGNNRSQNGNILSIDYKKYLKMALLFFSYLILTFIFAIGKGMSYAFLQSTEAYGFFNVGFSLLLIGILPASILLGYFTIMSAIFDKKIQKALERGLPFR